MSNSANVAERSLWSLSLPILLDLFLHQLTPLINLTMVGHLFKELIPAMSAGNNIFGVCIIIFSFISVGCGVVVSQYLGVKNNDAAQRVIHISVAFNFLIGLIIAFFLFFFGHQILALINISEGILPDIIVHESFVYLHILGICLIPEAVSLVLAACLRVYGKAHIAMFVTLIANFLTIIGNAIVLNGYFTIPQLGLWGVAWSTLIGRMLSVILLAAFLIYQLKIDIKFRWLIHWPKRLFKQVLYIGLPAAGENLLWSLHYITVTAFIALLGDIALAAQTIYFELTLFIMMFGSSVSIANEVQVGYLVGEKKFDRAYHKTFSVLRLGVIVTIIIAILFYFFGDKLVTLISEDRDSLAILKPLFIITLILEPCRTFNIVMVNALRASGDARFPLYMAVISMWGISIPLGYFLGKYLEMGLAGFWIAFLCDEAFRGTIHTLRWYSRRWQNKRLDVGAVAI